MTTTNYKKIAPTTKAHEVYDSVSRCIVKVGSRQECNRYWINHRQTIVRPVTDTRF